MKSAEPPDKLFVNWVFKTVAQFFTVYHTCFLSIHILHAVFFTA